MSGQNPTSQTVTDAIAMTECEAEVFDRAFTATTQPCPWPKAYGGDMVAQALVAASLTVTDGKAMHSMHSYFMRPVDIGADVRYEVEVLRDGRGYSTRQVRGFQNGRPVYVCLASFAAGEAGGSFAATAVADGRRSSLVTATTTAVGTERVARSTPAPSSGTSSRVTPMESPTPG